ncbi:hypothetical protein B0T24DRAFT_590970 [Lasiosphaeria ovina]|uniref:Fungal N-terminal domain-containing protein n=1 Tax=Lasiosphaeria ovina TaxID=92902 RepID=A0AAE0NFC6_9PEZI|nr:hypothetical protein B0T24DRAFT_590970 [Lasiosphaeria ovina]
MDLPSAAASVAGLVGLTAQIATSIKQLHDFWSLVADALVSLRETRIAVLSLANSTAALEERIATEAQKITASILESCSTISLVGAMAPSIQTTVSSAIETAMRSHLPQKPSSGRDTEITRPGNTRKESPAYFDQAVQHPVLAVRGPNNPQQSTSEDWVLPLEDVLQMPFF